MIGKDHRLYNGYDSSIIAIANELTVDGRFVALYGQEYSSLARGNHVNVFGIDQVIQVENGRFDDLVEWLAENPDEFGGPPVIQFNHPGDQGPQAEYGSDDFASESAWVRRLGRHASLIEILSGPTGSEDHPRAQEKDYLEYLNAGFRLAPTAGHDTHDRTWGTRTFARTAVLAGSLTRREIIRAMRERHVYATEDRNLEVIARVNGHLMGDMVRRRWSLRPAMDIRLTIHDPDEPNAEYRVEVFSDTGPGGAMAAPETSMTFHGNVDNLRVTAPEYRGPGQYLFLKVTQTGTGSGTDRAWTAPVWFRSIF